MTDCLAFHFVHLEAVKIHHYNYMSDFLPQCFRIIKTRRSSIHSNKSCSVVHEAKNTQLPTVLQTSCLVSLQDFPNVIGPNGSNYDSELVISQGVVTLTKNVSLVLQPLLLQGSLGKKWDICYTIRPLWKLAPNPNPLVEMSSIVLFNPADQPTNQSTSKQINNPYQHKCFNLSV